MEALALDTEVSTYNRGAPFDRRNKCICYSWANSSSSGADQISSSSIEELNAKIARAGILIGFNFKFDLHWFRKLGVEWGEFGERDIWCCQLAEFILSNQTWKYPSLNEASARHGLGAKIDVIAEKYWNHGVQTEDIPWEELAAYAEQDAILTLKLYEAQQACMSPQQKRLCRLQCMDLLILEEMEWNGIRYNEELCNNRATEIEGEIQQITHELSQLYPDVPINFGSGDQLSAFLYGGKIVEERKEHIGFFKTGKKVGEPRYRNIEVVHELPRLVNPLPRSELLKEGVYSTSADTLLKLRPNRKVKGIIESIQRQVRLDSLLTKTYRGIRNANSNGNWEPGELHGQFNQCVAATGRLSSSNPNVQNLDSGALDLFISRYS